jgi:protein-S-isoprenylcysteine O-methyltransferase Ste14
MKNNDHPGVYLPPPLIYAAIFFLSLLLQRVWPLSNAFFGTTAARVTGWVLVVLFCLLAFPALWRFLQSRNTLITIKAAKDLQTTGIYAFTRNPMYLGLLFLYSGIAFLAGNWWTIILIPLLIGVIQEYVIKREEQYLQRTFPGEYPRYRQKVHRWI